MSYPHLGSKSMIDRAVLNPNDPRNNPNSLINFIVKSSKAVARIVVPTFPQFVQFIIDSEKKGEMLDEHWTPINKFCTPCLFDFDVIAKVFNQCLIFFYYYLYNICESGMHLFQL